MVYIAACGKEYELDIDGHRHEETCPNCFTTKHPKLTRTIASLITDVGPDVASILKGPAFKDFTPRNWIDLALAAIDQAGEGEAWRAAVILERYRNEY